MTGELANLFKRQKVVSKSKNEESVNEFLNFVESHVVRASIARILGLIEILQLNSKDEQGDVIAKLENEVKDLECLLEELKEVIPRIFKDEYKTI